MDETKKIIKPNEDINKVFVSILKDIRQIAKGFAKLNDLEKNEISENEKKRIIVKQEKYKEKIIERQKEIKNKKILKHLKNKVDQKDEGNVLSNILAFSKIFLLTFGAAGLISIIGKTEIGKLIGNLLKSIASSFVSVVGDFYDILKTALKESADFMMNAVKAIFGAVGDFFKFIAGALTGTGGYNKLDVGSILSSFFDKVIVKSFYLVVEVFKLVAKLLTQLFEDNKESIKTGFTSLLISIFDAIKSIVQSITTSLYSESQKGNLGGMFDAIKNIFMNLWELLKAAWTGEFKNAQGDTTTFGNVILKYFAIWAGLQLGMLSLKAAMLRFGAAAAAFMDRANSVGSCDRPLSQLAEREREIREGRGKSTKTPSKTPTPDKSQNKVVQYAKNLWGKVTDLGEKALQGAKSLGNKVIDFVKGKVEKYSRYIVAIFKDSPLGKKIREKVLRIAIARLGPTIERLFVKLAAAAAGAVATGGIVSAIMIVLSVYDFAMLFYGLYELLFVDGVYNDIKQMVDDFWKEETAPSKEAPPAVAPVVPLVTPTAVTAPAAPTTKSTTTTAKNIVSAPAAPIVSVSAPAPSAPASAAPVSTKTSSAPATPGLTTVSAVAPPLKMNEPQEKQSAATGATDIQTTQVAGLGFGSARQKTEGVIIHHTGGNSLDVAVRTLQARKLSYHYLVDRDGRIVNILPDNLVGWHAGNTDKMPRINNSNTVSISMVAKDDTDVTPQQIASATSLENKLSQKYGFPKTNVYGHGEVTSNKHPKEGYTIASAIRGGTAPTARELKEGPGGPSLGFETPPNFQGSAEEIMKQMEATGIDMNELRDTFMQIFTENLMSESSSTTIINNVTNVENKKGSQNKKFTDPDIAEKIFKNAFAF
jgi:hypothetical protein